MKKSLRSQKQDLVRDAIHTAAIDLFTAKGFDETTVEEIAQSAGVSRRSFFRYFASKDDLLAQNVLDYGAALAEAVQQCPRGLTPLEVLHRTVSAGVHYTELRQELTRKVIEIASRSPSARQAHLSRMTVVEDNLAEAFAGRTKNARRDDMEPRLLSGMTIAIMNAALASWFMQARRELAVCAKQVFAVLSRTLVEPDRVAPKGASVPQRKPAHKSAV